MILNTPFKVVLNCDKCEKQTDHIVEFFYYDYVGGLVYFFCHCEICDAIYSIEPIVYVLTIDHWNKIIPQTINPN